MALDITFNGTDWPEFTISVECDADGCEESDRYEPLSWEPEVLVVVWKSEGWEIYDHVSYCPGHNRKMWLNTRIFGQNTDLNGILIDQAKYQKDGRGMYF